MGVRSGELGSPSAVVGRPDGPTADGVGAAAAPGRGRGALAVSAVVVLPLAALLWALLWRDGRHYISSDSFAQQSILQTWWHDGHGTTYLPPDTWLLKFPVYLLIEPLPLASDARLLLESLVLGGAGLVLTALAVRGLAGVAGSRPDGSGRRWRRWWDAALPAAWLGVLGGGLGQYLAIMPNSRNIELGLVLAGLALVGRYLDAAAGGGSSGGRVHRVHRVLLGLLAVVALAVLWVDDPYVAYLVGAPLAVACPAWFLLRRRDRRLLVVSGVLVASLVAIAPLQALLRAAGVVIVSEASGATLSPSVLLDNLAVLWPGLSTQVGLQDRGPTVVPAHLLTVAVLVAALAMSGYLLVVGWRRRRLVLAFLGGHWLLVVAAVLVNKGVHDFHAGRYLVLAVYDAAVVLGVALALLRPHRPRLAAALGALLTLAVLANVVSAAVDRPPPNARVAKEDAILRTVQEHGLTKGYAEFWIANLFIARSDGEVSVPEVVCGDGQLWFRYWLGDTARRRPHPDRTFVHWDPVSVGLQGCTLAGIEAQLGPPDERVPAAGGALLLIYHRDVADRIREPQPPAG